MTAVSWAGQHPDRIGAIVAVVARRGAGTRAAPAAARRASSGRGRGVPTVVAARGLIAGVFFAGNSYLPLMLTATHGWSLTAAGAPLVAAALGWAAASAWQGRHPDLPRTTLLRVGFGALAAGVAGLLAVRPPRAGRRGSRCRPGRWPASAWAWATRRCRTCCCTTRRCTRSEAHTAATQVADQLTTATLVGLGGALLAVLATPATALTVLLVPLASWRCSARCWHRARADGCVHSGA